MDVGGLSTTKKTDTNLSTDTSSIKNDGKPSLLFSKRLLVAIMLFLCFVNFQILRNNINITVVEMTRNKTTIKNNVTVTKPEFNWDQATVGLILSILAYGGLFSIFGDLAVNNVGGSMTCSGCLFFAGVFTMLHPIVLYVNFYLFALCRFVTGIFEMLFYISTSDIFARWFPKKERSLLIAFSFNGTNVGVATVYPFCGYLAHKWGWESVFYITGAISIFSGIVTWIVVKNQPSLDKRISAIERAYIMKESEHSTAQKIVHPYKKIFTSIPVCSLCFLLFAFMWISTIINASLPLYVTDLTHKETHEVGLISSVPNIVYIFLFPINGAFMSYWKNHSTITETSIHKIIIGIAFIFSSVMFSIAAIISKLTATLVLFVLIQIPMSFTPIILQVLMVNLAPEHTGVISSLCSFSFSLSAIVAQTLTGFMTNDHTSQEWNNCFFLAAALSLLGALTFIIGGSSEIQPWALPTSDIDKGTHQSEKK